jgi:hypothetical protein
VAVVGIGVVGSGVLEVLVWEAAVCTSGHPRWDDSPELCAGPVAPALGYAVGSAVGSLNSADSSLRRISLSLMAFVSIGLVEVGSVDVGSGVLLGCEDVLMRRSPPRS